MDAALRAGMMLANNALTNIAGLASLASVTWLDVSSNDLASLPDMSGLSGLQDIFVPHNRLTNVSGLSGLGALFYVDLSFNELTSIPPLAGLPNLSWIILDGNQLTAVPNFAGLPSLQNLYLQTNDITDLSNLAGLTNLHWLRLAGNDLQTITALTSIPNLYYVDVTYNILNLAAGSPASLVIQTLTNNGVSVLFEPQRVAGSTILSKAVWLGGGQFRFTLSSPAGEILTVQVSTNLLQWSSLATITNTSGLTNFTDSAASGKARFYRAVAP